MYTFRGHLFLIFVSNFNGNYHIQCEPHFCCSELTAIVNRDAALQEKWSDIEEEPTVIFESINNRFSYKITTRNRNLFGKVTIFSCHRCLINTSIENMTI
jgi:hypothetical protein